MSAQDTLAQWQEAERLARARLGGPGVATLAQLSERAGLQFFEDMLAGKLIRAEGKVISLTTQIGIAEGRIVDTQGKLYAYATTTCLVFPMPAG
ncbi:hypothetical protein [Cupriavidus basilensis]|nr:hypothetical protein [Cupriavidus basilensis]